MILFFILLIMAITLLTIVAVIIAGIGMFLMLFADVIIFICFLVCIIKRLRRKIRS